MNRKEFVDLLSTALAGRVPTKVMREQINYYREYISEEADKQGVDESEIIMSLGTPESIAHTIADSYEREFGPYSGPVDETPFEEAAGAAEEAISGIGGRIRSLFAGRGCALFFFLAIFVLVAVGRWIVTLIASYPVFFVALIVVILIYMKMKGGNGPTVSD